MKLADGGSYFIGKELHHIASVLQYITYQGGGNRSILGKAGKKNCFDVLIEAAVHIRDSLFIFRNRSRNGCL